MALFFDSMGEQLFTKSGSQRRDLSYNSFCVLRSGRVRISHACGVGSKRTTGRQSIHMNLNSSLTSRLQMTALQLFISVSGSATEELHASVLRARSGRWFSAGAIICSQAPTAVAKARR